MPNKLARECTARMLSIPLKPWKYRCCKNKFHINWKLFSVDITYSKSCFQLLLPTCENMEYQLKTIVKFLYQTFVWYTISICDHKMSTNWSTKTYSNVWIISQVPFVINKELRFKNQLNFIFFYIGRSGPPNWLLVWGTSQSNKKIGKLPLSYC